VPAARPAAAAPPATSGAFAFFAAVPTVPVTFSSTPLSALDDVLRRLLLRAERLFFVAALRDPLRAELVFARLFERDLDVLAPERLCAAAERRPF
jgi:hypothetical protein